MNDTTATTATVGENNRQPHNNSSVVVVTSAAAAAATTATKTTEHHQQQQQEQQLQSTAMTNNTIGDSSDTTNTNTGHTSVKLLIKIKASNQQYDDQIIESDLLWTVKRLKTQLSLVYPSKPPVAEQKLIYSGQLLTDKLLLKDVIRSYKDVYTQNHIFHLVYTPKNAPPPVLKPKPKQTATGNSTVNPANMNTVDAPDAAINNDGLRHRNVAGVQYNTQQQQQQQQQGQQGQYPHYVHPQFIPQMLADNGLRTATGNVANIANNLNAQSVPINATSNFAICPNIPNTMLPFGLLSQQQHQQQYNLQTLATQQAAMYNWMQQVYSQYMNQYTQHVHGAATAAAVSSTSSSATGSSVFQSGIGGVGAPYSALNQMYMPFLPPNNVGNFHATGASTTNPVIQFPSATATAATATLATTPAQTETPATDIATNGAQNAVADEQQQPIQQQQQQQEQAVARRFPNIVQEEQENRDWLDNFFSITRLAIFLTILYFNSSPLRCMIVFLIAGVIYLYHIGIIRVRHERNNNNINRNNNAAADQIRQGVQQVQQAQEQEQQQQQAENANDIGNVNPPLQNDNNDGAGDNEPRNNETDNAIPAQNAANDNNATNTAGIPATDTAAAANDNENTTMISFIRTFVITFFTSLLPEAPAL